EMCSVWEFGRTDGALGGVGGTVVNSGVRVLKGPASLNGAYGSFTFDATTGAWTYTLDNGSAAVQGLKAGQQVSDSLTVTSQDGTASQAIVATITGATDAATISGTATGAGTEDATPTAAPGALPASAADIPYTTLFRPASLNGAYGSFTFDATTGAWTYTLDNGSAAVQGLKAGQQVSDSLTVT